MRLPPALIPTLVAVLAAAGPLAPIHSTTAAKELPPKNRTRLRPVKTSAAVRKLASVRPMSNGTSSAELKWTFGGRPQRGWAVYVPLISNTVGAKAGIESEDFARAIGRWQEARAIRQTRVVDNDTWARMIGEFQSSRIKDRYYPSTEDLVEAPASEFYDPERPAELRQVDRTAYAAYKRMIVDAVKDPSLGPRVTGGGTLEPGLQVEEKYLKIISAFRTRDYQDRLRKAAPHSGRAGLAVNSPHFTGRALDLYVGGEPVSTSESNRLIQTSTPVYKWLVKNAARFGFHHYFYEPWHWEYLPGAQ